MTARHTRFNQKGAIMPEFHYSCTWSTWSRVLSTTDLHGPIVEVNLTPVHDWASEVAQIRIRFHGTPFGHCSYDKVTTELPARVRQQMVEKLGEELTERLLTEDFLPQIDYELYRRYCNGGANLEDIHINAELYRK